jgi:hypothetical protein
MTHSRRRFLQGLFAVPVLVAPLLRPAPLRCDADWMEAEWRAGRVVEGQNLVIRRPVRMERNYSTLRGCRILIYDPAMLVFDSKAYGCSVIGCMFLTEDYYHRTGQTWAEGSRSHG